jgi:hypothetical protein
VTECDAAPPSDQLAKEYCVPAEPCGEIAAIVCRVPAVQVALTGLAEGEPPSIETVSPLGTVVIETCTVPGLLVREKFAEPVTP